MTYVLRTYKDNDGNIAEIEQDKYSACFRLDVHGKYVHERRDYYSTIKSAHNYLIKHYPTMKRITEE